MGPNWQWQQNQLRRQQQQQQEQMRRQQEQLRRQQMGAAYVQQKRKKKQEAEARAAQADQGRRFAEVEREVAELRRQLAAGRLTTDLFTARLHELMVQDAQGGWWMMGMQSGKWYRYDGANWVPGVPPGRAAFGGAAAPGFLAPRSGAAGTRRRWGRAALAFLVGAIITLIVASQMGDWAVAVWVVGGIVTLIAVRKEWRGV